MNITVEITDTDNYSIAEVLELIARQVKHGYYRGFDRTTKEIDETEIPCNYFYQLSEND
jgi:hypothetical protein